jgi:hypothetical protein
MEHPHTPASRAAAFATTLLVLLQVARGAGGQHDPYVAALLLALLVVTAAVSLKLHRDNCLESRLGATLLALCTGGGVALAATVGLPGEDVHPLGTVGLLILAVCAAVVALLGYDVIQRVTDRQVRSPYAS